MTIDSNNQLNMSIHTKTATMDGFHVSNSTPNHFVHSAATDAQVLGVMVCG